MATELPQQPRPAQPAPATTTTTTSTAPAADPATAPMVAPVPALPSAGRGFPPRISRGWHIAKLVLGSAAIASSVVLIGLSAATFAATEGMAYELVWTVPVAGVAVCWQIAELITLGARGGFSNDNLDRGIHPGAHVGLHLVLWLGFVVNVVVNAFNAYFLDVYWDDYADSDYGYYGNSDEYQYLTSTSYQAITRVLVAFSAISLIIHFTLFVRACVETHARNTARRAESVRYIYVQQPVYYQQAGPNGSFVPPPPMQQQQFYGQQQPQQPQAAHYAGYHHGYYDAQPQLGEKGVGSSQVAGPSGSAHGGRAAAAPGVERSQPVQSPLPDQMQPGSAL